jgi:hypothetical protein
MALEDLLDDEPGDGSGEEEPAAAEIAEEAGVVDVDEEAGDEAKDADEAGDADEAEEAEEAEEGDDNEGSPEGSPEPSDAEDLLEDSSGGCSVQCLVRSTATALFEDQRVSAWRGLRAMGATHHLRLPSHPSASYGRRDEWHGMKCPTKPSVSASCR